MTNLFTSISEYRQTPQGRCTFHRKTEINRIILLLIGIALFFVFIFALSGPFVSVFIVKGISGATVSIIGFGAAGAVALGGFLIDRAGFQTVFLATGLIILASSFLPLAFYKRFGNNHQHI